MLYASVKSKIVLAVDVKKNRVKETVEFKLDELVASKGWKAVGNKFLSFPITKIKELSGEGFGYSKPADFEENVPEVSSKPIESTKMGSLNVQKTTKSKVQESEEPKPDFLKQTEKIQQIGDHEKDDKNSIKEKEDDGFHSGDTVDMEFDLEKAKKKRDQLDLFDE